MTRRILLGSGCDQAYFPRMRDYLESVQKHNTLAETFLVGVGWKPPACYGFTPVELPIKHTVGMNRVNCVQHGAFLSAIEDQVLEDDVIIYTDGDIWMQRDFSQYDEDFIRSLDDKTVAVGWNDGPHDTLRTEGARLRPRAPIWPKQFRKVLKLPVYNTGVLIATVAAYRKLFNRYLVEWNTVDTFFDHYANIQWCISWALGTHPELKVRLLDHSIHTHGHHPLPEGTELRDDGAYYRDTLILFRHKLWFDS